MQVTYRPAEASDEPLLKELTFQALYVPAGAPLYPRTTLELPEIRKYYESWKSFPGDEGIIAQNETMLLWVGFGVENSLHQTGGMDMFQTIFRKSRSPFFPNSETKGSALLCSSGLLRATTKQGQIVFP
jgi:hypothetical protein